MLIDSVPMKHVIRKNEHSANGPIFETDPTIYHDTFPPGYLWLNVKTGTLWVCARNTARAAVWVSPGNPPTTITRAGYDAIPVKDPNTFYWVTG